MLKDLYSNPIMMTDAYNLSHQELKVNTNFEVSHIYNRSAGMFLYGFIENMDKILKVKYTKEMICEAEDNAKAMELGPLSKKVMNQINDIFSDLSMDMSKA